MFVEYWFGKGAAVTESKTMFIIIREPIKSLIFYYRS